VARAAVVKKNVVRHAFQFVLDELAESSVAAAVRTRPMFGSLAVYIGEKITFILRHKQNAQTLRDDGVWVAAVPAHAAGLQSELPAARPVEIFGDRGGKGFSGWLNIPCDAEGFEEQVLHACRLAIAADPRVGKVPPPKRRSTKASPGASGGR
jgi:hypothetical protein